MKLSSLEHAAISEFEAAERFNSTAWLLHLRKANPDVIGVAYGRGDQGEPVILVLVQEKRGAEILERGLNPGPGGTQVVVRVVGVVRGASAGNDEVQPRPVNGGTSIGVVGKETGTMACRVKKRTPTGKSSYYVLSCNHVLAFAGTAVGDLIVQPGPADSLLTEGREIAKYSKAVPFGPQNKVDAAMGRVIRGKVTSGVLGIGPVNSWRAKTDVPVGLAVTLSGRVPPYVRTGTVQGVSASIYVRFGTQEWLFVEQLLLSAMASTGDSGALLMAGDSAVGLVFAIGDAVTFANCIDNVQAALGVTVSDTKWA